MNDMRTIDLNADLGEERGDDIAMLDLVSSANVACGLHAGTPAVMRAVVAAARRRGVVVGAHPSYRDREGFGRRDLEIGGRQLQADVEEQLVTLHRIAEEEGAQVQYVKPHGALYNRIAHDPERAAAVLDAMRAVTPGLPLVVLAGSPLVGWASDAGIRPVPEAFADRGYAADGTLLPRALPGAVLHDPAEVAERMRRLASSGSLLSADGAEVRVDAESICLHGDTPGAVAMAQAVREALDAEGVGIRSFVDAGARPSGQQSAP